MGTSGAYGGTGGWSGVGDDTQDWLDSGPDSLGDSDGPPDAPGKEPDGETPSGQPPQPDQPLGRLVSGLGRRLSPSRGGTGGGGGGSGSGSGAAGGGGGGGSRGRTSGRASSVGARAAAGAYGLRTGTASALEELGLSLDELAGLSRSEQARRLVDAALGPSGAVDESELRLANAELIYWALNEDAEPTPADLANRWVVEYVWQVWITEAGPVIRNHSANGRDSLRVEQEMRAALEATVSAGGLPDDRPLTTEDFEKAISSALGSLQRIGGAK